MDREAIRKLVDDIPEMIKREGYLSQKRGDATVPVLEKPEAKAPVVAATAAIKQLADPRQVIRQKKRWLWIGVGLFTALIFVIWAINVKTLMSDLKGKTSDGEVLWQNGKDEFKSVFEAIKKNDADLQKKLETQDANAKIEQTLKEILLPIVTVSSTATTTLKSKL